MAAAQLGWSNVDCADMTAHELQAAIDSLSAALNAEDFVAGELTEKH